MGVLGWWKRLIWARSWFCLGSIDWDGLSSPFESEWNTRKNTTSTFKNKSRTQRSGPRKWLILLLMCGLSCECKMGMLKISPGESCPGYVWWICDQVVCGARNVITFGPPWSVDPKPSPVHRENDKSYVLLMSDWLDIGGDMMSGYWHDKWVLVGSLWEPIKSLLLN